MRLRDIPLSIKIIASVVTFPIFLIIWAIACSMDLEKATMKAKNNPNKQNVIEMLNTYHRIKLGVVNHPDNWKKLRDTWYAINSSNRVPAHVKQQVIEKFVDLGLYAANTKVIDNYKE